MNCQDYQVVVYPGREREPRAALYRIVVIGSDALSLAWVLLRASEQSVIDFTRASDERDAALNALLERKLAGVRIDRLRFVIGLDSEYITYPIELDVHDYEARANPVRRSDSELPKATDDNRETHILTTDVIAGRTRVLTSDRQARALTDVERSALGV
ncbi:hypothetical protein [Pararobbsia alpina]|uniref:hypothetical protein n=1 Tax=Pararobbsia alpina TaxID=621374 RepID=UPI0039A66E95